MCNKCVAAYLRIVYTETRGRGKILAEIKTSQATEKVRAAKIFTAENFPESCPRNFRSRFPVEPRKFLGMFAAGSVR